MAEHRTRLRDSRSWRFDLTLCVLGLALLVLSMPSALAGGWEVAVAALVCVPLVVLVARFPMVLDSEDGGIEIGFDSSVLLFLLITFEPGAALAVWGLAVIATQVVSRKRLVAVVFNIGVGILAGALAAGTPRWSCTSGGVRRPAPRRSWRPPWPPPSSTSSSTTSSRPSRSPSTPVRRSGATSCGPAPGWRSRRSCRST